MFERFKFSAGIKKLFFRARKIGEVFSRRFFSRKRKFSLRTLANAFKVFFKTLALSLFDVLVLLLLAAVGFFFYLYYFVTPEVNNLLDARTLAQTSVIYDRTGRTVLYEIHGEENRKRIGHAEIPEVMRHATIAAEDDAFYSHFGIDPVAIIRAGKENFLRGRRVQGGSTITQQLARNVFLNREKTFKRKLLEAVIAVKIERTFDKDEILDAYLNVVPYGSNAYGVQAASEIYFGKPAKDLTLDEAALLAALPKATTTLSPYGNNTLRLVARQKMILERMRELGLATDDEVDAALAQDTLSRVKPFRQKIIAPHFVFYVIEQLEKRFGRELLERGGLKIITTLDLNLQRRAEKIIADFEDLRERFGADNSALAAVDPRTGEILAMVGSKDYFDEDIGGKVNVTVRPRQPGSAFKPIAYAAAFEKGYQPETKIFDLPTDFGPDGSGKNYVPGNYDGRYWGLLDLRKALVASRNVPAVKVLYLAGLDNTLDLAEKMGLTTLRDRDRYGLALVLGGAEVKLLELVGAYGVFANDGVHVPLGAINKVIYRASGEILYEKNFVGKRILSEQTARKINDILSDEIVRSRVFGLRNPFSVPGYKVAVKTGTTQNYRDAWTIGYTPNLVVGVWTGNNDGRFMRAGAAGFYAAAPIWNEFMKQTLPELPKAEFVPYEPVKSDKPMITGRPPAPITVSGTDPVGKYAKKKDKKKKSQPRQVYRSLLYYVNKDEPLSDKKPDYRDPMLWRWDRALYRAKE